MKNKVKRKRRFEGAVQWVMAVCHGKRIDWTAVNQPKVYELMCERPELWQ